MITVVQTFGALSMSTIEGIDIMAIKFKNIYQSVQKKQYDILDPRKTEFDVDFVDFMAKVEALQVSNIAVCNSLEEWSHHYLLFIFLNVNEILDCEESMLLFLCF